MTHGDFYVYEHWRPDTGQCFYVGKGRGRRARVFSGRITYHRNIVEKLRKEGLNVEIKYISTGLSEKDSYALEMERINFWKDMSVCLINQTGGGSGLRVYSEELRQRLRHKQSARWLDLGARKIASEKSKRHWDDPEYRKNISNKLRGRKHSDAHKSKMSIALRGRKCSEERRAALSGPNNPFWGKKHSPDTLQRIAQKKRGSRLSDETREKMRVAQAARRAREAELKQGLAKIAKKGGLTGPNKPYKHSDEVREKIRAAAKGREIPQHVREAQRLAVTGRKRKPFTEETLRKMSEAAKIREANKRARAA